MTHAPVHARPLTIGPVGLATNLLLAPIAGWCDLAWRETCRSLGGVGLACTDLLSPEGLICGSEHSMDLARTSASDRPIGMQLYGSDPATLADGARWCVDHGATVVDINMGCPVDKVCKRDGGSKLMCDVDGAVRVAAAVRAALPEGVPLTCKMRLGWSEADAARGVAVDLAVGLARVGVAAITVHGRTTEQKFGGACRLDGIRRVVEGVRDATGDAGDGGVPVIGNGDVRTPVDALRMLVETGCAGVMIGRGAFATPWIFRQAWAMQERWEAGEHTPDAPPDVSDLEPSEDEKLDVVLAYFERMLGYRGEHHAMHVIRQKISWLGKGINASHCKALKQDVRGAGTPGEVRGAIEAWRATHERVVPVA